MDVTKIPRSRYESEPSSLGGETQHSQKQPTGPGYTHRDIARSLHPMEGLPFIAECFVGPRPNAVWRGVVDIGNQGS